MHIAQYMLWHVPFDYIRLQHLTGDSNAPKYVLRKLHVHRLSRVQRLVTCSKPTHAYGGLDRVCI